MNAPDIDEDPYLIDSWESYCKVCVQAGRKDVFVKKLSQYIYETNNHQQKSIDKHVCAIVAEDIHQRMEEARLENNRFLEKAKKKPLSKFKSLK